MIFTDAHLINNVIVSLGKISVFTPFPGFETSTLHLSNRLKENSYSAHAEAFFLYQGMSAVFNATKDTDEFDVKSYVSVNGHAYATLKSRARISEDGFESELNLDVPILGLFASNSPDKQFAIVSFFAIDTVIRLNNNPTIENTGFELKVNHKEVLLVSLENQKDGTKILSFLNPWQPMRLKYAFESTPDLTNYQVCSFSPHFIYHIIIINNLNYQS